MLCFVRVLWKRALLDRGLGPPAPFPPALLGSPASFPPALLGPPAPFVLGLLGEFFVSPSESE